jgi:4,5-DOPA dioxygenase extradiol
MHRRNFIKNTSLIALGASGFSLQEFHGITSGFAKSPLMPAIFIGHGTPMNAINDNAFTQSLTKLGKDLPRPNAIAVVSAHWLTDKTFVSVNPAPKTIYDFDGFPEALYKVKYEPKGHPDLAKEVKNLAPAIPVHEANGMGLDHGAWTVLKHIYPKADIPVFQLSIDYYKPPKFHYELGQLLKKLREKGVLIIGSGNIVHNLGTIKPEGAAYDWAIEFDGIVKEHLDNGDFMSLVNYQKFGKAAQMSVPSHDHYTPMLYTLGLSNKNEHVKYFHEGLELGSISMRSFMIS